MKREISSDLIGPGEASLFRSSDQIKSDVVELIKENDIIREKDIDVAVADGKVTLRGRVKDESEAQEAENAARTVLGVTDVENDLEIAA